MPGLLDADSDIQEVEDADKTCAEDAKLIAS